MTDEIRQELMQLSDPEYRDFSASLNPGVTNMLGVRLPQLRQIAKRIARSEAYDAFLRDQDDTYFELTMLRGLVIDYLRLPVEEILAYIRIYLPQVTCWSLCDSFAMGLSMVKKDPDRFWEFALSYRNSPNAYDVRFCTVMLLAHFVDEEHIGDVLSVLDGIRHDDYYVKMGVAWVVSVCFAKFPQKTLAYLRQNHLDAQTYRKSLQKILESNRVSPADKEIIRSMRKSIR